jgi:Immunity protein 53
MVLGHCDGDWEHSSGVSIGTIDNPGWSLDVELAETNLAALFSTLLRLSAAIPTGFTATWRTMYLGDEVAH